MYYFSSSAKLELYMYTLHYTICVYFYIQNVDLLNEIKSKIKSIRRKKKLAEVCGMCYLFRFTLTDILKYAYENIEKNI